MTHPAPTPLSIKEKLRQLPSLKAPLPEFDMSAMPATPHEAFGLWLESAVAANVREPHAMTLSTVDEHGEPDARVLILKNVDTRGWHFAIKSESPKARQIATQPKVALTFYWPALGRQNRMRGEAVLLPAQECAEDFLGRPVGSRVSAIASTQSDILGNEQELAQKLVDAQAFLESNPAHVETGWCVYAVAPTVVEFWQGATDRNHKRLRYTAAQGGTTWTTARLWP